MMLVFSRTSRLLHFLLGLCLIIVFFTKEKGTLLFIHSAFGIAILLILGLRLMWFFGGETGARLSSFDLNLSSFKNYFLNYLQFKHSKLRNPAASFAAITMMLLALFASVSGLIFIGAKYGSGIFYELYFYNFDIHLLQDLHEVGGNLLFVVVISHIVGVLFEHIIKKTGIAKTMLHISENLATKFGITWPL